MQALVLEKKGSLALREIDLPLAVGPRDVKIKVDTVGVCGSDVHYFTHGRIGPFVVREPMVLGHEAAGVVVEVGAEVSALRPGDRVCMEPGIPDFSSRATLLGLYNLDPKITFWATPPVHGCLTSHVVHPESFTHKLPDNVSFAEGALVEPFAVGLQAATQAGIAPGDVAVVTGGGTIGVVSALAALAGGCSRVFVSDVLQPKVEFASRYPGVTGVNVSSQSLQEVVSRETNGWGADLVIEASGSPKVYDGLFDLVRPGGTVVLVGMPVEPVHFDVVAAQVKQVRIESVFRYANVYGRAIALIASGRVNLKPFVTETYPFEKSIAAFERAAKGNPADVKLQIKVAAPS